MSDAQIGLVMATPLIVIFAITAINLRFIRSDIEYVPE